MSTPLPAPAPGPGPAPEAGWVPDVLDGFEQRTLALAPDFEGEVVATLVRRRRDAPPSADAGVDVLYVHGWTDYFFQTHLADFWEGLGVRFHALDLRKYGRSLRPHHTPGFITRLRTYDEDIEAALAEIGHGPGAGSDRRLVLMGHSTGGLVLSLWAHHRPGRADALVLNSPWLEFQTRKVGRLVLEPSIRAQAAIAPRSHLVNVDLGFYARSISARHDGAWELDAAWRPDAGWRVTPAWLAAIFSGHDRVARGLTIDIPILVLLSARSTPPVRWSEDMMRTDTVLDVVGIAARVPQLGRLTTLARIEGALHDVTLSAPAVRDVVWFEVARWFRAYVPPAAGPAPEPEPRGWRRWFSGRRQAGRRPA
ncbi:alpha-beta hydrolase superfamily lysophospholipase [Isoptericola sp. CG 20/1183]|uniref:Alpha-beta hydrolase superfamily lysophospholipase n=1 Tax=Isoptericola halotolerans TaxID=300560 RepID=A0ABX5EKR4_9MICO|nr:MULTISPECIES: alpha/beta hydrolase [Isoptericola]PRZ08736.1 alpha-beta hydrolase superfamily lysophospholipase [Isoptericola halotolerans]PRZ10817.1 alpha-beta hydrolase superfamily lysophospholipase [Isoptericola sp. CG 20/1183]